MSFKKLKTIFWVCLIFFIGTLVYFFISGDSSSKTSNTASTTPVTQKKLPIIRVESFSYSTSSIDLTVEYVQIVQSSSSSLEKMINDNSKKEAEKLYKNQLQELRQSVTPEDYLTSEQRSVVYERKVQKERVYIDANVSFMSFPYTNYIDTGGAHGTFFYSSETIDLDTGKKLALKDFLQGGYDNFILSELNNQIQTSSSTETCVNCYAEFVDQATEMFVSKNFIFTEKGIVFLYGAYDLGAYALTSAGQEILVSKDILEGFISRVW